jgi:hypothetical protein
MHKKTFIDSIRVGDPCTENWDEMTGNDRVRFCSHCAKDVNNFSAMTPRQAARLVRKSGGKLCIRYRVDPRTNAPVFADRISAFARHGVAAGAIGASVLVAGAYAQTETAPQQLVQIERTERSGDASARISGYVTDPNGAVIPYALVTITNQESLLSQIQNASAEGFYEFKELSGGTYKIHFEGGGFQAKDVTDVYLSDASEIRRDGQLDVMQVAETVEIKSEIEVNGGNATGGVMVEVYTGPRSELVTAVLDGDLEDVKARIMMRAKVNVRDKSRDGISPLHAAVETGNLEIAAYLLEHGAKANIRSFEKLTPLMMMDSDATPEMFDLLLRYGAKINLVDKEKNNILHHAAENDVPADLMRRLATYGLNVNAVNREGKTALMIAAENGNVDAAKALIESGADVNVRTRDGHTALSFISASDADTRSLLETYGAIEGIR